MSHRSEEDLEHLSDEGVLVEHEESEVEVEINTPMIAEDEEAVSALCR